MYVFFSWQTVKIFFTPISFKKINYNIQAINFSLIKSTKKLLIFWQDKKKAMRKFVTFWAKLIPHKKICFDIRSPTEDEMDKDDIKKSLTNCWEDWPLGGRCSFYVKFLQIKLSDIRGSLCVIFTILISFSRDNALFASKAKINVFWNFFEWSGPEGTSGVRKNFQKRRF